MAVEAEAASARDLRSSERAVEAWEELIALGSKDVPRQALEAAVALTMSAHVRVYQLQPTEAGLDRVFELGKTIRPINESSNPLLALALGMTFWFEFGQSGDEEDLRAAAGLLEVALQRIRPSPDAARSLAPALQVYARACALLGALEVSAEHFDSAAEALDELAATAPDRVSLLGAYIETARVRVQRFSVFGDPEDLDWSVERYEKVLADDAATTFIRLLASADLGDALTMRSAHSGDLERAVEVLREADAGAPERTIEAAAVRAALADALLLRYDRAHDREDANEALQLLAEAEAWADDHVYTGLPDTEKGCGVLLTHALALLRLFEARRDPETLDAAIERADEVVERLLSSAWGRNTALVRLAECLLLRFELSGHREDLDRAEEACREAVARTGHGGLLGDAACRTLCTVLTQRPLYGEADRLEEAVSIGKAAVRLTAGAPDHVASLLTLARARRGRYVHTGDGDELARLHDDLAAASSVATSDSEIQARLNSAICEAYLLSHYRTRSFDDASRGVDAGEAAVAAGSASPYVRAGALQILASALSIRREAREEPGSEALAEVDREVELLREALSLTEERSPFRGDQLRGLAIALAERASLHGDPGDTERARVLLDEAIDATPGGFSRIQVLQVRGDWQWSRYLEHDDNEAADAAVEAWEEAVALSLESSAGGPVAYRLGHQGQWAPIHAQLVEALVVLAGQRPADRPALLRKALVVAEGAKSRLLSELLGRSLPPAMPGVEGATLDREAALVGELTALDRTELAEVGMAAALDETTPAARASRRGEIVAQLQAVWAEMSETGSAPAEYVALRRGGSPRWEELEALARDVGDDTALVSFLIGKDSTFVFVLRASWVAPEVVAAPLGRASWDQILARLFREVHRYDGTSRRGETWHRPLQGLFEQAQEHVAGAGRVVIAPANAAHLIPWGVVAARAGWTDGTGGTVPVVTIPALPVLARLRRRGPAAEAAGAAVVAGNPLGDLRFAEEETRVVAAVERVKPLVGRKVTKSRLVPRLRDARTVHLATHAYFQPGAPLDSGIVLADGVLSAREALGADMHADLVVLSACETGMSGRLGGDELAGLAQAFLFAGARSLVVTLWAVDDPASAATMKSFYERLHAGRDKSAALADAVRDVRSAPEWSHSYYWGAFCLTGTWE